MRAIMWFRRDLRLADNTALTAALKETDEVIGLFVLDSYILGGLNHGAAREAFVFSALEGLDAQLRSYGARLVVRSATTATDKMTDPDGLLTVLEAALKEAEAGVLYFNRDYSPFARRRDARVDEVLRERGYTVKSYKDLVMVGPTEVTKDAAGKEPVTIYTPYRKRWQAWVASNAERVKPLDNTTLLEKLRPQSHEAHAFLKSAHNLPVPKASDTIKRAKLDDVPPDSFGTLGLDADGKAEAHYPLNPLWFLPANQAEGVRRLAAWVDEIGDLHVGAPEDGHDAKERRLRIGTYDQKRDLPAEEGTSRLSPFIRHGVLSIRQCYAAAASVHETTRQAATRDAVDTWIGELVWRDFYYSILYHNPAIIRANYNAKYNRLTWLSDDAGFTAWCEGRTGYPIIDAGMRQMNNTHWMHNRVRMIVASFLTKDLLIDWRLGERYFWRQLVDGDVAANNGGWQWSASTGTDAQPYFRIFNPVTQGQKFDPTGAYIRRYVPELVRVPDRFIHSPWQMPTDVQQTAGCVIGKDYPTPIVDHATARVRTLAAFKNLTGDDYG